MRGEEKGTGARSLTYIHHLSSPTTRAVPTAPTHVFDSAASPLLGVIGVVAVAATVDDDDDDETVVRVSTRPCSAAVSVVASVGRDGRSVDRSTPAKVRRTSTSMSRPPVFYNAARPLSSSRFLSLHHVVVHGPPRPPRVDQTSRSTPGDSVKT